MEKSSSISTGVIAALILGLFFSISYSLLGYTIRLSIIFGVIGAIAGGLLSYWLQIESVPEIPEKPDAEIVDSKRPPKPPKKIKKWPKTAKERSGVSMLNWFMRQSQISQKSRKKY